MGRSSLALGAGCVAFATVCATAAATGGGVTELSRTITARWPDRAFRQTGYLRPVDVGSAHVRSVTAVFPNGTRVASGRPDTVVACAHSGASYASLGWVTQAKSLWVTVVLQTGQCSPGPSVAGRPVTIRLVITTS